MPNDSAQAAREPTGALTIFEALEKQLGLKLEKRRRLLPVIVIDRLVRNPIAN
ncbi:MAG: TIGR03435 family protein [Acidobacteriota bacterium]|nr:TIGR03435 family protein [Acidobacteriota bacterium]